MKLITVFLIMCLVYISPSMQAKDFPKRNAFVIVDIKGDLEAELSLSPYQDCKLLSGLEYKRDKEYLFTYKVPKDMLLCQLLLSCRVHTGENYYGNLFQELVYLNTDSVWLTIDSCTWEINWHGDPENTASQRFNTILRYPKRTAVK